MDFKQQYDVIVIGGGHAGTEAALAGRASGRAHAAAHAQYRNARPDELQSGHRRHRQGSSGQGDRCAGRRHGAGGRSRRHPVAHVECIERAGRARHALPGRSRLVQGGDPATSGNAAEPVDFPAVGRRSDARRQSGDRCRHPDGPALSRRDRRADRRHLPRRQDPCRLRQLCRRPRGRSAGAAPGRTPARAAACASIA